MDRNQKIIKTSFLGIGVNVLLSILKLVVGTISGSIAITLDAVKGLMPYRSMAALVSRPMTLWCSSTWLRTLPST